MHVQHVQPHRGSYSDRAGFFSHKSSHSYIGLMRCMPYARLGGGIHLVTLQIANRMAGSLRNTRLWTLPCCQLSESINHMVSLMVSGSAAPRAQFSRTTCRLVAMAPVPHGERSCRAVTDGMSMRVPLPCMKSSNGSHQFRMVRAARARDLPIRMVRAARARDLPFEDG
jgi:hypothetical protein